MKLAPSPRPQVGGFLEAPILPKTKNELPRTEMARMKSLTTHMLSVNEEGFQKKSPGFV